MKAATREREVARYCPNRSCRYTLSKVVDSRPLENGAIRRTRQCPMCGARWTTLELTIHVLFSPGPVTWEPNIQTEGGSEDESEAIQT